jgi:hypothetical protein
MTERDERALDPQERDLEAPIADAYEQSRPADPAEESDDVHLGPEVNEYDAVEQGLTVNLDDDYDRP